MSLTVIRPFRIVVLVHHEELFHAVTVEDRLCVFERGADRNRDQVLLGHHVGDREIEAGLEAEIAVG